MAPNQSVSDWQASRCVRTIQYRDPGFSLGRALARPLAQYSILSTVAYQNRPQPLDGYQRSLSRFRDNHLGGCHRLGVLDLICSKHDIWSLFESRLRRSKGYAAPIGQASIAVIVPCRSLAGCHRKPASRCVSFLFGSKRVTRSRRN